MRFQQLLNMAIPMTHLETGEIITRGEGCVCVCGHTESTETWVDLRQDTNCFLVLVSVSSVQFSRSVVSDSLGPHESQHARPPCPSLTPGVHSNSSPLSPHTSLLMGVHGGALVL